MLGFFKKKMKKDPYLERVASILHQTIGTTLPLENAYNLAEECLHELRNNISKGMFQDGANPRENIMAYYSLCSMVNESSASDDKMDVLKISIMAQLLKEKLGEFESMSSLEKGIWQFGEQALLESYGTHTKGDIEKIRADAVQIIMDLMREQEVTASQQDVAKIVKNVSSNIGDKEVSKVGEKVLAVSVLSNATGYYIDQGENDLAHSYFMCTGAAIRMHFEGQMDSYSEHQSNALNMIMQDYHSLGEELMSNSNYNEDNSEDEFWKWIKNKRHKAEPQEIKMWSDLKELELRSTDLSELPDSMKVLTGLIDLSLFHNNFSIVPEVVFNLSELTWLNFGVNQLSELPPQIGQLKKLKILDLGENQLTSLPSEIGEF